MILIWLIGIIIALSVAIHYYQVHTRKFWKKLGITSYQKHHPLLETYRLLFKRSIVYDDLNDLYNGIPDKQVYGVRTFGIPQLIVKDPDILRNIMVKDFDHFVNHLDVFFKNDTLFGKSLFVLKDKKWRDMRYLLSPVFTGSKLRGLCDLISECADQTIGHYTKMCRDQNEDVLRVDINDVVTRLTNDAIATAAFGIQVNSVKDPNNEFFEAGREITKFPIWRFLINFFFPRLNRILKLQFAPKYIYDFFINMVDETVRVREEKNIVRPDLIHLMMEARKEQLKAIEEKGINDKDDPTTNMLITNEDITAQGFVFFVAGYANVALIMSFAAYELAVQPDIQKRLQKEIEDVLKETNGKIDYDGIKKMKYLDMVVSETLRKWPPAPFIDRECTKAYKIESDGDIIDVPVGLPISIPIIGLHYDPKYFPDPYKFDPERFNDENRESMNPFTYMPFGAGPRVCIAVRFVMMEAKIFLIHMLTKFDVVVTEKTPIPMVLAPGNIIKPKDGWNLGLKLRS